MSEERSRTGRKIALGLFAVWALVFVLGVMGELLGIESLRKLTDFKQLFLK